MPSVAELEPLLSIAVAIWGLVWGSFANVVIARVPQKKSVVTPASHCPQCGEPLRWYDNLPVLSYLVLRGRCRSCGERIGLSYLLVELVCGIAAVILWLHIVGEVGAGVSWVQAGSVFVLQFYWMIGLIALGVIDGRWKLLPHRLTIPLLLLGLLAAWLMPRGGVWVTYHPSADLLDALVGAISGMVLIWGVFQSFLWITGKIGIGGGDMFMVGAIGAWFGWQSLPLVLLIASLMGVGFITISLVFTRSSDASGTSYEEGAMRGVGQDSQTANVTGEGVAFGPFLVLGSLVYMFIGDHLMLWLTGASV